MVKQNGGFSFVELMVALATMVFLMMLVFGVVSNSRRIYFTAEAGMDVRNQMRNAIERMSNELRNTGLNSASVAQYTITTGAGASVPDSIKFSIPIVCSSTANVLDVNGDVAYWGAPLTYGCNSYTCMDQNNSCATLEYKYLKYVLVGTDLTRQVLSAANAVVASTVIARNISNFKIVLSADQKTISYTLTGSQMSAMRSTVTLALTETVRLANRGGG